ncbi:hypothetical protein ACVWY4_005618, partial [Bacillus mycoides]
RHILVAFPLVNLRAEYILWIHHVLTCNRNGDLSKFY